MLWKAYPLVVDAHSKWPQIVEMSLTATYKIITETLRHIRCLQLMNFLLNLSLVSYNGAQVMTEELAIFMQANGIKQIKCATCHLALIGAVERLVQIFKKVIKSPKDIYSNLRKPLLDPL